MSDERPWEDYTSPVPAVTPTSDPYSATSTVGRMATDAVFGLPDTLNMAARGLNTGVDAAIQAVTGRTPPPATNPIPYVAPIARQAMGVSELPADASMGRILSEAGGSALMGGVGSAATRGVMRGVAALPDVAAALNPWRTIKNVTSDALEKSGENWYNALDNLDVRYNAQAGPGVANAIDRGGFKPTGITTYNAEQAINRVNRLNTIDPTTNVPYPTVKQAPNTTGVASGTAPQPFNPAANPAYPTTGYIVPRDIEDVRQALNRVRAQAGGLPGHREDAAANIAIGGIDRFLADPPASAIHPSSVNDPTLVGPVLANARADTAAGHRLGFLEGTVDNIGTRLAAKPAATGSDAVQALRDRAAAALNASAEGKGPLYGYSDYEKQLLRDVATASRLSRFGSNAPKSLGGIILQSGPTAVGASMAGFSPSATGMLAAALPVSEYAAKKLGDWGTRRAYQKATEAIAARSPLAQSMGIAAPPSAAQPATSVFNNRDAIAAMLAAARSAPQGN